MRRLFCKHHPSLMLMLLLGHQAAAMGPKADSEISFQASLARIELREQGGEKRDRGEEEKVVRGKGRDGEETWSQKCIARSTFSSSTPRILLHCAKCFLPVKASNAEMCFSSNTAG